MIFTVAFWKGAGERAIKTFVQSFVPLFVAALGASAAGTLDVWAAPWLAALESASGVALGAAFLSLMFSLGNADFVAGAPAAESDVDPAPEDLDGTEQPSDDVDEPSDELEPESVPQVVASDMAPDDTFDPDEVAEPRRAAVAASVSDEQPEAEQEVADEPAVAQAPAQPAAAAKLGPFLG